VFSRALGFVLVVLALGCASSLRDRAWLERELVERTGAGTRGGSDEAQPSGVNLEDGLDEPEVIAVALWRNPLLAAELTRIDAAFATLDEARRPANPQVSLMGPIGPVTAVATLLLPLESLWQMPSRTESAARDADVAGESVLMRALDVVRDARLLHVELGLAADRARVRAELAEVAAEAARIVSVRADVGEVSPLEARMVIADAQTSADLREVAETEVAMARTRLLATLALDAPSRPLHAVFEGEVSGPPALRELLRIARIARPDARAAELAISAAGARAGWEETRLVNLGALVDAQWNQAAGPGVRLGGRADLPIFNQNQGGIGRAEAEVARATAQHEVVARTAIMEVTLAHTRFAQASRSRARFEVEVLAGLDEALRMATQGFETGDQTFLVVLDALRRVGEARLRHAELVAEQRRALAELERAIGARLSRAAEVATRIQAERELR
jgi:cobalt-zinc-cadmium efflux system outer membrane protein